ncbi:MAG: hypothetical protein EBU08_12470 [Micrococcales bacterium]|jgi:predicted transcriptional regulator|nr:hypothetical protein [Micrococcales bacterium]
MRAYVIENDSHYDQLNSDDGMVALKAKIREEMIGKLAAEWNTINRRIEDSWRSQEELCADQYYLAEMCQEQVYEAVEEAKDKNPGITKDELREVRQAAEDKFYEEIHKKDQEIYTRKQVIEDLLSELGARMARPYEHWNEMESYMEYQENRYDNQDW